MFKSPSTRLLLAVATASALTLVGCAQTPPPQAAIPANPGGNYVPHQAPPKPMPESAENPPGLLPPGPYQDEPILDQRLPQEQEFLAAYNGVHQPRIAVYVNRTLTGQIIPPNPGGPIQTQEHTETATGGVTVSHGDFNDHADAYGRDVQQGHGSFSSGGPATYTESTTTYQPPSDSDEAELRTLDYQAIEKILMDWMSCGGRVHLISPDYLAAHLSPADLDALSQGKPIAMGNLADKVGADILIQVQAHPTHQTNGPQVRLVAEAMNVRGGDEIGTAVVDIPLPMEKPQINQYTRFIAAKLMMGMSGAWESYASNPPPPGGGQSAPPPPPPVPDAPPRAPLPPVPPAGQSSSTQPVQQMFIP